MSPIVNIDSERKANFKRYKYLLSFFLGLTALAIGQDYLESTLFNYFFYLSESVLYKVIWLLFVPMSLGIFFGLLKYPKLVNKWLLLWTIPLSLVHILLASWLMSFIAQTYMNLPFSFSRLFKDMVGEQAYLILIIYAMIFLFFKSHVFAQNKVKEKLTLVNRLEFLSIKSGGKIIRLPTAKIHWIQTDSPYISVHCEEKKYFHASTLENILNELNPEFFVRIHRSTIVNINKIAELKSRGNGDYDVILKGGKLLRLSRTYSKELKNKF